MNSGPFDDPDAAATVPPEGFDRKHSGARGMASESSTRESRPATRPAAAGPGSAIERLGPYEIIAEIGRGGMGVVYKAFHPGLKRTVALKVLIAGEDASEEALQRFQREGQAVAKLGHHPNIVPVYDIGSATAGGKTGPGRLHYIAMHFVEGGSLDDMIDEGPVDPLRAAGITRDIAAALHHAHSHGVLHRDVKPANILLALPEAETGSKGAEGKRPGGVRAVPMLTDFGLAKDTQANASMTGSGVTLGTPNYMPPEQAEGKVRELDARSDVWALGATLYDMLATRPPFDGQTAAEVIHKILLRDPAPVRRMNPAVDRDLETICMKCLEKEKHRRYASAADLESDLERYIEGRSIAARPVSLIGLVLRKARRNRAAAAAIALLGFAAMAALAVGIMTASGWRSEKAEKQKVEVEKEHQKTGKEKALALLDKQQKVSRVLLGAQSNLSEAHDDLRRAYHSFVITPAERAAVYDRHRATIDAFVKTFSGDSASKATALAVKGWLLWFAVRSAEAWETFEKSMAADPDVPWGFLFASMGYLTEYMSAQNIPELRQDLRGLMFTVMPETPFMLDRRKAFEKMIARAESCGAWSGEALASFRSSIGGFRKFQSGDLDGAGKALTEALMVPEFFWIKTEIRRARAKTRYYMMDFGAALEDTDAVLKAYPEFAEEWFFRGRILSARGTHNEYRSGDGRDDFVDAGKAYVSAAKLDPGNQTPMVNAASAAFWLGESKRNHGGDPTYEFDAALGMLSSALEKAPGLSVPVKELRGRIAISRAMFLLSSGRDPREVLSAGIADLSSAAAESRDNLDTLCLEGQARKWMAMAELAAGGDPFELLDRAIATYGKVIEAEPSHFEALNNRGIANRDAAEILIRRGQDPVARLEAAARDFDAVVASSPDYADGFVNRGNVEKLQADVRAKSGADPTPLLKRAIADYDMALSIDPLYHKVRNNKANAIADLGSAIASAGGDPRDAFRAAEKEYRSCIDGDPSFEMPWSGLGTVLKNLGDAEGGRGNDPSGLYGQAMDAYDRAISMQPQFWAAMVNKGLLLERLNRHEEALETYLKARDAAGPGFPAIERNIERARANCELPDWARRMDEGTDRMAAGDYARAREIFDAVLLAATRENAPDLPKWRDAFVNLFYNASCIYAVLSSGRRGPAADPVDIGREEAEGLRSRALLYLEESLKRGWSDFDHIAADTDLDPIRKMPEFEALLRKYRK